MPNWCSNKLTVTGPKADVEAFMKAADHSYAPQGQEKTTLCLEKLHPCPPSIMFKKDTNRDSFDETIEKLWKDPENPMDDDWYSWRVRNWGTKWDVVAESPDKTDFKNGKSKVVYVFDSAWAPPEAAFRYICNDWPTLTFRLTFREESMGYKGCKEFHAKEESEAVDNNSVA